MTHSNTHNIHLLHNVLGDSLRYIWFVRSPDTTSLIDQVCKWVNVWSSGKGAHRFHYHNYFKCSLPAVLYNDKNIDDFIREDNLGKSIILIKNWLKHGFDNIYSLSKTHPSLCSIISFEDYIVNTHSCNDKLKMFLDTEFTKSLPRIMRKQRIPRPQPLEEITHKDYNRITSSIQAKKITD